VVLVLVADAVGLMGAVILLKSVGDCGIVGSFAIIFLGGILLEERRVRAGKDCRCKSPPGVIVYKDEEDGGWWVAM
jgi:hypothetical protein